ncbi:UNVERIFIED_CONTAM: putative mitochondrial protein [Sesamum radiatum]|uniref:Mitochondrial protein n=1 Tax=Sesamum radiatum TaxID=300843 RepID=A0AAW2S0D1_SESRA
MHLLCGQLFPSSKISHGESDSCIREVKSYLDKLFTVKDLGVVKYYLGLEIARSPQGIAVTQAKYIRDLLMDTGLAQAKSATTLLPTGVKFTTEAGNALSNSDSYRQLVGIILYLRFTRPDIAHADEITEGVQQAQGIGDPLHQDLTIGSGPLTRGRLKRMQEAIQAQSNIVFANEIKSQLEAQHVSLIQAQGSPK